MHDRWIGWVLEARLPPWLDTIDALLANPGKYGARLHLCPPGVGGYGGQAGRALCGVHVPPDGETVKVWAQAGDPLVAEPPRCKRCLARGSA
jgi:hypothetical protein